MTDNKVVIFDLDDTLFKEIDFLKSAYSEISDIVSKKSSTDNKIVLGKMLSDYNHGYNVFEELLKRYEFLNLTIKDFLKIYRSHIPKIKLKKDISELLESLYKSNIPLGLITDGREEQQTNKINALDINHYFEHIIISEVFGSEKPSLKNFTYFENIYGDAQYFYIGDNTKKDFISPNKLNWTSICLIDNGENIHKQDFNLPEKHLPTYKVENLSEILQIIKI